MEKLFNLQESFQQEGNTINELSPIDLLKNDQSTSFISPKEISLIKQNVQNKISFQQVLKDEQNKQEHDDSLRLYDCELSNKNMPPKYSFKKKSECLNDFTKKKTNIAEFLTSKHQNSTRNLSITKSINSQQNIIQGESSSVHKNQCHSPIIIDKKLRKESSDKYLQKKESTTRSSQDRYFDKSVSMRVSDSMRIGDSLEKALENTQRLKLKAHNENQMLLRQNKVFDKENTKCYINLYKEDSLKINLNDSLKIKSNFSRKSSDFQRSELYESTQKLQQEKENSKYQIINLNQELQIQQQQNQKQQNKIKKLKAALEESNSIIQDLKENKIAKLQLDNIQLKQNQQNLEKQLQERDQQIEKLFKKLDDLYFNNNDIFKEVAQQKIDSSLLKIQNQNYIQKNQELEEQIKNLQLICQNNILEKQQSLYMLKSQEISSSMKLKPNEYSIPSSPNNLRIIKEHLGTKSNKRSHSTYIISSTQKKQANKENIKDQNNSNNNLISAKKISKKPSQLNLDGCNFDIQSYQNNCQSTKLQIKNYKEYDIHPKSTTMKNSSKSTDRKNLTQLKSNQSQFQFQKLRI